MSSKFIAIFAILFLSFSHIELQAQTITAPVASANPACINTTAVTFTATTTTPSADGVLTVYDGGVAIPAASGTITGNSGVSSPVTFATPGNHTITVSYVDQGSGATITSATALTLVVTNPATLSYPAGPWCSNATPKLATFSPAGGVFTSSPAGLTISAANGTISVTTSTPGTYTVTYTPPAATNGCGQ